MARTCSTSAYKVRAWPPLGDCGDIIDGTRSAGDSSKLIMALAACLLGYGEVGLWLKKEAAKPDSWVKLAGNAYLKWIEDYAGETNQGAVKLGLGACFPVAGLWPVVRH